MVTRRIVAAHGPAALMAAPLVWVATELGRTYFLTGFPWVLLGYSQASVLPIAQLASLFGVYGVSMLVASVSAAMASHVASQRPLPVRAAGSGAARHRSYDRGRRRRMGQLARRAIAEWTQPASRSASG